MWEFGPPRRRISPNGHVRGKEATIVSWLVVGESWAAINNSSCGLWLTDVNGFLSFVTLEVRRLRNCRRIVNVDYGVQLIRSSGMAREN